MPGADVPRAVVHAARLEAAMSCECHNKQADHAAYERQARVTYLPQYEAERRMGYLYHCPSCIREARGELAGEQCYACPPGRHRLCDAHV